MENQGEANTGGAAQQAGKTGPLEGVKVLELGQLIAGPFAAAVLAWFGAEVIKVEPPGTGDPLRSWRVLHQGTSLWWYSMARNKKCITLNLRVPQGQEIARELVRRVDVVLENFRPGTLERWGLGYAEMKRVNPRVILARISGFGQSGPYAQKPGFAVVAEAVGGLRYLTGEPGRPPVRPNLSLGDSLAGLHAALGVVLALYQRDARPGGEGQVVDVALYEAVFNMLESVVAECDKKGIVREREGFRLTGIAPSGTYPCGDAKYVVIGGNNDSIFKRFMLAIERADLAGDPRLERNSGRVQHADEIDAAISQWTSARPSAEVIATLEAAEVPAGPIYTAADMLRDPHFQARGLFEEVDLGGGDRVRLPAMAPQLSRTPGGTRWIGPPLGAHNRQVYSGWLGYSEQDIRKLQEDGAI